MKPFFAELAVLTSLPSLRFQMRCGAAYKNAGVVANPLVLCRPRLSFAAAFPTAKPTGQTCFRLPAMRTSAS